MEFKFKKGDKVIINLSNMFTTTFCGSVQAQTSEASKITDSRVHANGRNQYKVKGYSGWWYEDNLIKA